MLCKSKYLPSLIFGNKFLNKVKTEQPYLFNIDDYEILNEEPLIKESQPQTQENSLVFA